MFRFYLICLVLLSPELSAGFRGNLLALYQFGDMPGEPGGNFSSFYNRSLADYHYGSFTAGITLEQFHTPFGNRNYMIPSQFRLHYLSGMFEVRAGHFYETLGRGMLLRSYDMHGAILEERSYRTKHYFHSDIAGASFRFNRGNFSAGILYGKPLNNAYPAGMDNILRRPDNISAIQSGYTIGRQSAGISLMMLENHTVRQLFGHAELSGGAGTFLSYYGGIARRLDTGDGVPRDVPHAFYGSVNISFTPFIFSLEYKNYRDFNLGSGFNEPPAVVREHSYRLLNRSTHILQPANEKGYMAEAFWMLPDASVLVFSYARAVNEFEKRFIFTEYFIEYSGSPVSPAGYSLFASVAEDHLKGERSRITIGFRGNGNIGPSTGINAEFGYQQSVRDIYRLRGFYFSPGVEYRSRVRGYFEMEFSNDPLTANGFPKAGAYRRWTGGGFTWRIMQNHNLQLFGGQRRGGPSCLSGICYEIPDFRGVEIRFTGRF